MVKVIQNQVQLEFHVYQGHDLNDIVSKYEVKSFINYKVIASNV
jgi:hypothetical protein